MNTDGVKLAESDVTNSQDAGERVKITFQPAGRTLSVPKGDTLFNIAADGGVQVNTTCGGGGSCGECKVRFDQDPPEPSPLDYMHLSAGEIGEGYRLSCQVTALRDIEVHVPPTGDPANAVILHGGLERKVALQPNIRKIYVPYANPREFQNISDWDRARRILPRKMRPTDISLRLLRQLPAVGRAKQGMTMTMAGRKVIALEAGNTVARQFGVAFDIGSTTVVGFLIDLATGEEAGVASAVNEQRVYGDDIIARLAKSQRSPDGLARLNGMIIGQLNGLLKNLAEQAGIGLEDIFEVTVVGNMAMHHFLLRLDSTYLGLSPYAPVIREAFSVCAGDLELDLGQEVPIFILPNIAGFVGSDTVAVALASQVGESKDNRIAIDVGTNGEMILGYQRNLIACSAPAGPALEGARIKMGMRAAAGAIDHVWIEDDVRVSVIDDAAPVGICGSALIDIAAQLSEAGLLNSSGAYVRHADLPSSLSQKLRDRLIEAEKRRDTYFILVRAGELGAEREIVFTQQDVREMQLAKGAIRAGTMVLLQRAGLADEDLDQVLLAGAFGNFIDPANARRCGLTPQVPVERILSIGNAAGVGAKLALVSVLQRRNAIRIAQRTEHYQLSGSDEFQKAFAVAMQFPKE